MNNFKLITSIIPALTETEKSILSKSIRVQSKKAGILDKLYQLLVDKGIDDLTVVKVKLYGKDDKFTSDSFRKACDRFLVHLFNAICNIDAFIQDRKMISDAYFNRKLIRGKLDLIHSLKLKRISSNDLLQLILPLEKICEEYELLEELIILKKEIYVLYELVGKKNDRKKSELELVQVSKFLSDQIISDLYVNRLITFVQHSSIDNKSLIVDLENAVKKVGEMESRGSLNTIQFNYLMLKLQYYHFIENFQEAEYVVEDIIKLVNENKSVRYFYRITQNYMNLSYTQLFLGKYQDAYDNSMKAKTVVLNSVSTNNLYREGAIFPLIYLNKLKEADELLEDILSSGYIGNGVEEFSKRKLMHAFVKYLLGDYKAAFVLLQDTKESESDKEGWNLGVRMMNIYLTLSTDKVDLADQRIGSMRKHIERTSKMRNLRKRDVIIFRILSHLSRSGFDFKETWEDRQKDFDLLRNGGGDYRWIPRSHELIIFDQWFEAKMLGKPYQPVFPKPPETVEK